MAKKKYDYRAEQARKRNQQKLADKKQAAKEKEFFRKYGKQIIIGVVAAIVVIVAIWLGCKWFVGPGGSIPNWFGTLRNVEEDWLITNTGTTSNPKYFKMGEYTAPEGYTLDADFSGSSDALNQAQYYNADDENALVQSVYVCGVRNIAAADQLATVLTYYTENSGAKQATIAGHDVHYAYITYDSTQTTYDDEGNAVEVAEEDRTGYSGLCMYIDTVQDSSVLVMLNSKDGPLADVVPEDQLFPEAEKFLSLLTIEKE